MPHGSENFSCLSASLQAFFTFGLSKVQPSLLLMSVASPRIPSLEQGVLVHVLCRKGHTYGRMLGLKTYDEHRPKFCVPPNTRISQSNAHSSTSFESGSQQML